MFKFILWGWTSEGVEALGCSVLSRDTLTLTDWETIYLADWNANWSSLRPEALCAWFSTGTCKNSELLSGKVRKRPSPNSNDADIALA